MPDESSFEKAGLSKRLIAKLVDILVAWVLSLFLPPLGIILGLVYLGLADGFQRGQSLGKMVLGLEVVGSDGGACDLRSSFYRNLPFVFTFLCVSIPLLGWILLIIVGLPVIAIEIWLMATDERGERLGDRIAGTHVVEGLH